jgi:glutathione S-transferase
MAITVWGRASSVNVQKVLWALDELGLEYRRIDAGGRFGGTATAEYLAMNPNGLIPTLRDATDDPSGGSLHWESNSILRYLGQRYGTDGLWPADPLTRSLADRWMDWALTTIGEPMRVLFWGFVRDPARADLNAMSRAEDQLGMLWARLDAHLASQSELGRAYVAGDRLTLGDIPAGCQLQRYLAFPITRPALPHLLAWHGRLAARPGYARHVMVPME